MLLLFISKYCNSLGFKTIDKESFQLIRQWFGCREIDSLWTRHSDSHYITSRHHQARPSPGPGSLDEQ